jgi:hypothetical protein
MAVIEPAGPVADPVEEVLPVVPVVPVVPPAPAYGHPVRWPWLVLTVTAGLCALTLLLFGCLGMFLAEEIAVEEMGSPFEYRLAALLCGLVPGLFLVAAALFGVFRAFRRRGR